jgi:TPR repeat protein
MSSAWAQTPPATRRVALVIGNAAYSHVEKLTNPGNDAQLIATTLRGLGFTLVGNGVQQNLDKPHFDQVIQAFGKQIQGADIALFYYAGHGMQVDGTNWLLPIDANPTQPRDVDFQMVDANLVLKQMNGAGTRLNIVLLDACRNNPFSTLGTRAVAGGLAQMRAPEGTLISFATQPGNVASDGKGADGPYATALVQAMRQPGLDIFHLFNQVGLAVKKETGGAQLPWVSSSPIDGDFFFSHSGDTPDPVTAALAAPPGPAPPVAAPTTREATAPKPAGATAPPAPAGTENAEATTKRALALLTATDGTQDPAQAFQLLEKAAAVGYAPAQYQLALFRERGVNSERSYEAALQWYRKAAEQNYIPAELAVARFYGVGLSVERDMAERKKWLLRAAGHGSPIAEYLLGNIALFGRDEPKDPAAAAGWLRKSSDRGSPLAQVQLAIMYEHGNGVPKDYAEALRLAHLAADRNNAQAQNIIGRFHEFGFGVPKDQAEAVRWYRMAADKGFAAAQFNLARHYASGDGIAPDRGEAMKWFGKAAAQGNQLAAERLAKMEAHPDPTTRRP